MNIPFAKKALASQASRLGTAMALAIGGMIVTLEAAPAAGHLQEIERISSVSYAELQQKAKSQKCISAANEYIACLDEVLALAKELSGSHPTIGSDHWIERLESVYQLEETFDAELVKAKLLRTTLLPETREARKLLGMVRIRLSRLVGEFQRLEGNVEHFDSDIDLQGFYALSDARNKLAARRFH